MRSTRLTAVALAAVVAIACGGRDENSTTADNPNANATIGTGGEIRADDASRRDDAAPRDVQGWVRDIGRASAAEIELGKIAEERGANAQVKQFGQMMVRDHTMGANELKQVVAGKLEVPEEMDEKHRDLAQRLRGLQGAEFDREYMNAMVEGHEEVKDMIESRANEAANNEPIENAVNQWAAKTLPKVEQHLQHAVELRDRLRDNRNTTH
jgi:putative membrane protein